MSQGEVKEGRPGYPDWEHHKPLGPIVATLLAVIGWLVFILVFALYWSNGLSAFQDVIVTIVSLVIMGLLIGLGWVIWGFSHANQWKDWAKH